ncbi:TPA: MobF family relaxase [Enterobacter roggenkampii]
MMSVAPVASAGEAAGYYSNSDNYYFLGSLQSLWMGEGAKELGLEGNVRGDDLTAVLEGRLPDGSRLGKEVNGQHVHRPGHDLTFSAPKSVSILALIGNDKEMVEAHTGGRSSGDDGACSYAPGGERDERRRCPGADHQILYR